MHDIVPPKRWQKAKTSKTQPMRGLRLRGQSIQQAKNRLSGKRPSLMPKPEETIQIDAELPAKNAKKRFAWWRGLNRNLRFAIIAAVLLVFGAGAFIYYTHLHDIKGTAYSFVKHKKAAPTTVASPLTGVQVTPEQAARPVTGIMIENSDFARPQSGLQDAGVVYEAIAEAGITRFLALFQDSSPQYIGPVRSLRPYYIDFAAPFQASIVHVGGSPDALAEVSTGGFRNLDQFANGGYFERISARDAPHNVYTSFAQLDQLNQIKGYTTSSYNGWPRKKDKKIAVPTAKTLDFAISSPDFYAHYDYDATSNSYLRGEAGAPHLDLVSASDGTGVQLKPKVVIAVVMPLSSGALDASGAYYSEYQDSGSGTAYVFQDGGVTVGQWSKSGTTDQIKFTDSAGNAIPLDAGQTWITVVGSAGEVTYKP